MKQKPNETRAAVIAALLAGQGVNEVARQYKISAATVSRIKKELPNETLQRIETEKKERLVDLVENHLRASLKAAVEIAEQAHDHPWRARQSAENLAVFYGVLTDKSLRLVEVAGRVFHGEEGATP